MTGKPVLVFISTRFLFPADSGGKIRTTQILRGLKGGSFHVRLLMPCDAIERTHFSTDIADVCDEVVCWKRKSRHNILNMFMKILSIVNRRPIPVVADKSAPGAKVVGSELAKSPAVAVFDFPHAATLAPTVIPCPTVIFTHNIEAEIFRRHLEVAATPFHRWLWRNQHRKMLKFEKQALSDFDTVIAVSARDCEFFSSHYSVRNCRPIPTGVDTDFFEFVPPRPEYQVVFCGSMDWLANVDGIEWFFESVWPNVKHRVPQAKMKVVGRTPPASLVRKITSRAPEWTFTGYVDDVRPHIAGATAFVIPLRVGGGTRIKAFEAMAMGAPVVSTSVGIEGLEVVQDRHYLSADTATSFADAVISLLEDHARGLKLAIEARQNVDLRFGFRSAAKAFEDICRATAASERAEGFGG